VRDSVVRVRRQDLRIGVARAFRPGICQLTISTEYVGLGDYLPCRMAIFRNIIVGGELACRLVSASTFLEKLDVDIALRWRNINPLRPYQP